MVHRSTAVAVFPILVVLAIASTGAPVTAGPQCESDRISVKRSYMAPPSLRKERPINRHWSVRLIKAEWAETVGNMFGRVYTSWAYARDRGIRCQLVNSSGGKERVSCVASARPCRAGK